MAVHYLVARRVRTKLCIILAYDAIPYGLDRCDSPVPTSPRRSARSTVTYVGTLFLLSRVSPLLYRVRHFLLFTTFPVYTTQVQCLGDVSPHVGEKVEPQASMTPASSGIVLLISSSQTQLPKQRKAGR